MDTFGESRPADDSIPFLSTSQYLRERVGVDNRMSAHKRSASTADCKFFCNSPVWPVVIQLPEKKRYLNLGLRSMVTFKKRQTEIRHIVRSWPASVYLYVDGTWWDYVVAVVRAPAGTPSYKTPEEYYDEVLELRKQISSLDKDNSLLRAKLRRVEEDNTKKEKEIESLMDPNKVGLSTICATSFFYNQILFHLILINFFHRTLPHSLIISYWVSD